MIMNKSSLCLLPLIVAPLFAMASLKPAESEYVIGLAGQYAPEYAGSDKYDADMAPYFSWRNQTFQIDVVNGISYSKEFNNGIYLGQSLGYSLERSDDNETWLQDGSRKLKGMGKIKMAMTSTSKVGWWMAHWIGFEGDVIAPLTDSQGMQYNLKLNLIMFEGHNDTVTFNVERNYGDARYNNTWYGVNESQSVQSGYKQYKSGSGLNNTNYGINWQHSFSDAWTGYADLNYTVLADRISKSPIVDKDNFFTFTIGAFYSF